MGGLLASDSEGTSHDSKQQEGTDDNRHRDVDPCAHLQDRSILHSTRHACQHCTKMKQQYIQLSGILQRLIPDNNGANAPRSNAHGQSSNSSTILSVISTGI